MANIKSQKKRIKTAEKARMRNKACKSELKTAVKAVRAAVEAGDKEAATAAANKAGKPFLVEAIMENIVVPTPGCWNINDIYSPNELVAEGKLVKKENGRYVAPSHAKSHKTK